MSVRLAQADAAQGPRWADFPVEEYRSRVARLQHAMLEAVFDLLLLTKRENVVYLSGLESGHWQIEKFPTAILLVHARSGPVLVMPDYFAETARGSSWISELALYTEPHVRAGSAADVVVRTTLDLAGPAAVIGLELGQNMVSSWNLADYHAVRDALPKATFRSAASVIWACRMVKSPGEVARLREVARVSEQAMLAVRDGWRSGMTEREVASALAVDAFRNGADGVVVSNVRCGPDRYPMADTLPVDRPTAADEMLVLHVGFSMRSYVSELSHNAHIGTPTAEHRRIWAALVLAQEAVVAAARPGARGCDVYQAYRRVLVDHGLGPPSQYCGHGIGMAVVEPPYLSEAGDQVLERGMVLALEPWLADVRGLGVFGLGEMAVVTDDGAEMLTELPREGLWTMGSGV